MMREKTQYFQFCIVHAVVWWSKSSCNLSNKIIKVECRLLIRDSGLEIWLDL